MNENKKIIVFFAALVLVIGLIVGVSVSESKKADKKLESYLNLVDKKDTQLLFLGRPTCTYCVQFTPIIEALSKDYDFKYEYINTDDISSGGLSKLLKKLGIDEEEFGTPYLVVTKAGKVLAEQSGYLDREPLFDFLKEHSVIGQDQEYKDEYPNLTNIDYAKYQELLSSSEKSIVVLGQTGCGYCTRTKPVLDQLAEKYGITINYLNMTDLSEDDSTNLFNSTTYLKELDSLGTPLTMIIQNGEVIDHIDGYNEASAFESVFQKQGLIK